MSAASYTIYPSDIITSDGIGTYLRLHDSTSDDPERLHVKAMVASGDYFETLAVRLETIADALPVKSVEQYQLQDAITQLLYLQREYVILKKH
ncbi:MAG TPA: hypothetical protein VMB52_04695 [Verrucomicrobiae bacterium]|nr:hypothetical protein [Verrucomicrobiae bacterium]